MAGVPTNKFDEQASLPHAGKPAGGSAAPATAAVKAELDATEARIRLITERISDVIIRADLNGRILYISPSCRVLGYEPHELMGQDGARHIHPEDVDHFRDNTRLLIREGRIGAPRERQHRFRRKDGSYVWLEGNPTLLTDATGRVVELINVFRDVTDRRRDEERLAESEARYRLLADSMTDIIVRFGPDGLIRYVSPACRLIGADPERAIGKSVLELLAPAQVPRTLEIIAHLFTGEDIDPNGERLHHIVTPDGREVWLEGSPTLIRDKDGNVVEVISTLRDVTQRRNAELALADSEQRFRRLAENARDIISRCDREGRVTYFSPAFELLTGFSAEEMIGRLADDNVLEEDRPALRAAFVAALRGGRDTESQRVQFRSRCKDGRVIWLESQPLPEIDAATGKITGVTDVVRDITQRVALEAELHRARAEAEAAAESKADLLATMSHELRTPLTSVIGFGRLVAEQPELSPKTRSYVTRMAEASRALMSAVNDILDFSKLEAGKVTLNPAPTDIADLARMSLEMFQPQAGAKDIALEFDCHVDDGLTVMIDPDRTRQVLLNLIGNAVKFTDHGAVTLSISYDTASQVLEAQVSDTGPGIPADGLDRLFQRYGEVDGALTRSHGGTGLGLAICKGIIDSQDGQIGAANRPTGGSCFYFSVPAPRTEREEAVEGGQTLRPFTGVRVLVVDDHPANRELAGLFLGGVGAEVTHACDGAEAVEVASRQPFDAILMDLRMPNLDGPGALRALRSRPGPNDLTPVLAFTAESGDAEIIANLQAAGFQGLVPKPLTAPDLIGAIAEVVN